MEEHIGYREWLKPFGGEWRNRYLYSLYLCMGIVKVICHLHNYANVDNLKGYVAHFCYIRLKSFDTFLKVVEMHNDYVSAKCILRMLADSIAVFRLIYIERDENIRLLRHALYVIEGCEQNLDVLPEELDMNEGAFQEIELEYYNQVIRGNRDHRKRLIAEASVILDHSPLKEKDQDAFNKIVEKRNWKFKNFDVKTKSYSWTELYEMIDRIGEQNPFSFLSQYVHGLSMSNLVNTNNAIDCNGLLFEGIGLLETMIDYMLIFFKDDQFAIFTIFLESEMQKKLFWCFDDEHRPKVNEWNGMVYNKLNSVAFK
ncbi:MAG: hypothetical protein IKH95_05065 [Bacteroidaceae bacterium]|nr:hypothetical protein [Bacteroidaceae bacterium]